MGTETYSTEQSQGGLSGLVSALNISLDGQIKKEIQNSLELLKLSSLDGQITFSQAIESAEQRIVLTQLISSLNQLRTTLQTILESNE